MLHSLEQALSKDRVKPVLRFFAAGTGGNDRKRTRGVEHGFGECPTCHDRGTVKKRWKPSAMRSCVKLYVFITLMTPIASPVYASPAVAGAERRITRAGGSPAEIFVGKQVKFRSNRFITRERFDVVMMW